jgi:hypothetical protein
MNAHRREEWKKVLDSELERWTAKSIEELLLELREVEAYQVDFDSKRYNVEVQLLENTNEYIHVLVDVDDGSLPASFSPLGQTFIRNKTPEVEKGAAQ